MKLSLWTDGGARGNPGPAAAGIVLTQAGQQVYADGVYLGGRVTNNQAEYSALLLGLEKAMSLKATEIECYLDSQLVVEQVKGNYKVKDAGLLQQWQKVKEVLTSFDGWTITYIPRAQNAIADGLVNKALDEQLQMKA